MDIAEDVKGKPDVDLFHRQLKAGGLRLVQMSGADPDDGNLPVLRSFARGLQLPEMTDPAPDESLSDWWQNIPYRYQLVVPGVIARALKRATAEERERCAKVCEAVGSDLDPQYADHIASAIRSGAATE